LRTLYKLHENDLLQFLNSALLLEISCLRKHGHYSLKSVTNCLPWRRLTANTNHFIESNSGYQNVIK